MKQKEFISDLLDDVGAVLEVPYYQDPYIYLDWSSLDGSDYSGDICITESNVATLMADRTISGYLYEVSMGYSGTQIRVDAALFSDETAYESLKEYYAAQCDYPLLDEHDYCERENKLLMECWERYGADDFLRQWRYELEDLDLPESFEHDLLRYLYDTHNFCPHIEHSSFYFPEVDDFDLAAFLATMGLKLPAMAE